MSRALPFPLPFPLAVGCLTGLALSILACPKDGPPPHASNGTTPSASVSIVPSASVSTTSSATEPAPSSFPLSLLGAVKTPVFSDDPCTKDADCAPVATCHPDRCVSVANVGTLPPGTMCTEMCMGQTIDCGYNHCACRASKGGKEASEKDGKDGQKRCAMVPGRATK